jgi:tetratricopeptide (TPR) repeat protein
MLREICIAVLMWVALVWVAWNVPTLVGMVTDKLCDHNRFPLAESILKAALKVACATDFLFANAGAGSLRIYTPRLRLLEMLSSCHFKQGDFSKSFECDEQQLQLLTDSGNHAHVASRSNRIAVGYMLAGRFDQALALSERCLPVIRSAYNNSTAGGAQEIEKIQTKVYRVHLAEALFSRAWILEELRRYDEALSLRKEALNLMESEYGPDAFEITPHLNRLGNLNTNLGNYGEAEPLLLRCLEIRQAKKSDEGLISSAQQALGDLYCTMGKLDQAEAYCSAAYATALKLCGTNKTSLAEYGLSRASLWAAQGKYEDARKLLEQSIADTEPTYGHLNPRLLPSLELLEECLEKTNRRGESEKIAAHIQEIRTKWNIERSEQAAV